MFTQRLPALLSGLLLLALVGAIYVQVAPIILAEINQTTPEQDQDRQFEMPLTPTIRQYDIAGFDLFGNEQSTAQEVVEEIPAELPATTLQLKLTGILATEANILTGALIEGPNRDTDYYKPGDSLPGDAVLKQVHPDRVVLDRNGRLENLYFSEEYEAVSFDSTAYPEPQEEVYSDSNYTSENENTSPEESSTPQVSEAQKYSIKERLNKLRSRIMTERQ
jgi:general secretion pathway protein C